MAQTLWIQVLSLCIFHGSPHYLSLWWRELQRYVSAMLLPREEFKPLLELPVANIDITQNILCTFVADKYFNHTPNKQ